MSDNPDASRLDRLEASLAATVAAIDALRVYGQEEAHRRNEEARRRDQEARRRDQEARRRDQELRAESLRRAEEDRARAAEYDRHQRK